MLSVSNALPRNKGLDMRRGSNAGTWSKENICFPSLMRCHETRVLICEEEVMLIIYSSKKDTLESVET